MATFTIATWNVNSIKVRLPQVESWLKQHKPDVLGLQETKTKDENFPVADIERMGYHVIYSGQKAYNGMAILSKKPITEVLTDIPNLKDEQRRILIATINDIRIVNLYVPNGETVDSPKYQYKLMWLEQVTEFIRKECSAREKVVVVGDFNIAPEDRDVHDPKRWEGKVLCSDLERRALQSMLAVGLEDSFRLFEQPEKSFSWWNYRMLGFRRNHGLRIDHILVSKPLVPKVKASVIDKEPRKWERPSDHAPVITTFAL